MSILYIGPPNPLCNALQSYCANLGTTLHVIDDVSDWGFSLLVEGRTTVLMLKGKKGQEWINTQKEVSGVWFQGMPRFPTIEDARDHSYYSQEMRAFLTAAFGTWLRPIFNRPATPVMKRLLWGNYSARNYLRSLDFLTVNHRIGTFEEKCAALSLEHSVRPLSGYPGFKGSRELALTLGPDASPNLAVFLIGYKITAFTMEAGELKQQIPPHQIPCTAIQITERLSDHGIEEFLVCYFFVYPEDSTARFIECRSDAPTISDPAALSSLVPLMFEYLTQVHSPHFPRPVHGWSKALPGLSKEEILHG